MVILSSVPPPSTGIRLEQPCTKVFVDNRDIGKGTLFIAESCLSWVNSETNTGFSLTYQNISLHAISRDLQARPYECLYVMVDTYLGGDQNGGNENENDEEEEEEEEEKNEFTEMYFVPDDTSRLNAMFTAMNECQALNPDPDDSISEEEEFEDADSEGEYLIGNGTSNDNAEFRTNGSRNMNFEAMDIEEGQFEDADSSPEN